MKRILGVTLALAIMAALAIPALPLAAQASGEMWLHVRVEKSGDDGETVRVNIPLSLAEAVLPAINAKRFRHGRIRFRQHGDNIDIRAILAAVKDVADGEFVSIERAHETIRVTKTGGYLMVKTDSTDDPKAERISVKVPLIVVEALLSGAEDELNLAAAIKALREFGAIDLVTVEEDGERVRVWIDSSSSGE